MTINIGDKVFWDWEVKKIIGSGGFGTVCEAEKSEFGNVYKAAVKVISIPSDRYGNSYDIDMSLTDENIYDYYRDMVKTIVEECRLLEKMKGDSHIVSYEDHTVEELENGKKYRIFIRMELLTPLVSRIRRVQFSENEVIKLGIDICQALETCRKYNVIHRDVKPENIFISETDNYKLGDFGIAKVLDASEMAMSKKGTQNYVAPEVFKGEAYDASVDIYSLGLVLFRLLNHNRGPFMPSYPEKILPSDEEKAIIRRIKGEQLPSLPNVSKEFMAIIHKACNYTPSMRYDTPREMRRALEEIYVEEEETTYTKNIKKNQEIETPPEVYNDGDSGTVSVFKMKSLNDEVPEDKKDDISDLIDEENNDNNLLDKNADNNVPPKEDPEKILLDREIYVDKLIDTQSVHKERSIKLLIGAAICCGVIIICLFIHMSTPVSVSDDGNTEESASQTTTEITVEVTTETTAKTEINGRTITILSSYGDGTQVESVECEYDGFFYDSPEDWVIDFSGLVIHGTFSFVDGLTEEMDGHSGELFDSEGDNSEFVNFCWSDADSKQFAMELSEDIKPGIYTANFYQWFGEKMVSEAVEFEVTSNGNDLSVESTTETTAAVKKRSVNILSTKGDGVDIESVEYGYDGFLINLLMVG